MKNLIAKASLLMMLLILCIDISSQSEISIPKIKLSEDGKHYIQASFLGQMWMRHTDMNQGTTVFGEPMSAKADLGIRRLRMTLSGQLTDKVYFYTQFGMNNFNDLSKRYVGSFFHDAVVEYHFSSAFQVGTGLTGWSGLSRYASPSIGSLLAIDAPLFLQVTNGVNDQFLRKLSVYAKGQLGKLDYRFALTNPMAIQNSTSTIDELSINSNYNPYPAHLQTQGYVKYQFLDKESNNTPYSAGSYLGKKKVFNLGIGTIYQPKTFWNTNTTGDTSVNDMLLLGIDLFYDAPLNKEKENALSVYLSFNQLSMGEGYLKNIGVMNPANGNSNPAILNGGGNGFPAIGNGTALYGQIGYLFGKKAGVDARIQLYTSAQVGLYDRLESPMIMTESGFNYFVTGNHSSKITVNYQLRPIYESQLNAKAEQIDTKGMFQIQYQISI